MTKKVLCMNPGPIEFEQRVLEEFSAEGISHVDKTVIEVFGQALEKMRKVFLAPDGQPLVVAGSGTLGWDMVGANLINHGEHVLVVNTGYFGDSFGDCLERYGAKTTHLRAEVGHQPTVAELSKVLTSGTKFKLVTITHVDTSTGVLAHVKEFAAAIRKHQPDAIVVVDGVCALGGEECRMKQWDLDVVLTGSQKCVGVPAGLSLLVIRPRALQAFEKCTSTAKYYVDWRNWLPIMKNYEARQPSYFATPAVNHLFALNKGLDILLENGGIEQRFKEHQLVADAVKEAMKALGCSLVTVEGSGAHTLTCVRYPPGVGATDFLPKVVKRGVSLAGGLHKKIKTEYFRIGHMGPSTRRLDHVLKTVQAIEEAFIECGHKVPEKGKAVKIIKKLQSAIPIKPACSYTSVYHGCPVPPKCQMYTIGTLVAAFAAGFLISELKNIAAARRSNGWSPGSSRWIPEHQSGRAQPVAELSAASGIDRCGAGAASQSELLDWTQTQWLCCMALVATHSLFTPGGKAALVLSRGMAWRCSALSNEGLVDNLARAGIVQSQRVIHAMKATDRAKYMGQHADAETAYQDAPQLIGHQQTISAPHMHAFALELADVAIKNVEQPRILDVGAGSGYLTACLGRMVEDLDGRVFGIERIPELVAFAQKNIAEEAKDLVEKRVISVQSADGWEGLPNEAPFHFIHVGAAAVEPPQSLMNQLANGGRLVVPVGEQGMSQVLLEIQRTGHTFTERKLMGVSYVPLVRERTEL